MIRIRDRRLSVESRAGLRDYQATVNIGQSFGERLEQGKRLFKARNRATRSDISCGAKCPAFHVPWAESLYVL